MGQYRLRAVVEGGAVSGGVVVGVVMPDVDNMQPVVCAGVQDSAKTLYQKQN